MLSIKKETYHRLSWEARDKECAAAYARAKAQRAEALIGTYNVGPDKYSGDFWDIAHRPDAHMSFSPQPGDLIPHGFSLHRLPNGDWMEVIRCVAWTRHTYDLDYALDRMERRTIGGYVLSPELHRAALALKNAGANRTSLYAIWQDVQEHRGYVRAYSGPQNATAAEMRARWLDCLRDDMAPIHDCASTEIATAIAALDDPYSVISFPAPIDPDLSSVISELRETISIFKSEVDRG